MTAYEPAAWHDLFVTAGGSAAALTGLLFVAVSINLREIIASAHLPVRAAETLSILVALLLLSLFLLAPGQSRAASQNTTGAIPSQCPSAPSAFLKSRNSCVRALELAPVQVLAVEEERLPEVFRRPQVGAPGADAVPGLGCLIGPHPHPPAAQRRRSGRSAAMYEVGTAQAAVTNS